MPHREGMSGQMGVEQQKRAETEREKRARAVSIFIEDSVIGGNESLDEENEKEIAAYYKNMSPREKADVLYSKMMAFMVDRQVEFAHQQEAKEKGEEFEPEIVDPYLISEIKMLFGDEKVKALIPETYGEARVNQRKLKISELGKLWEKETTDLERKEALYKKLEQDIFLNRIKGETKISAAKSRMAILAENLTAIKKRKEELEKVEGFPQVEGNTDSAALFQYEQLREYQKQLKKGFVWLPSRVDIHRRTIEALQNHRWPVLIGEAGSGKSEQADAAAMELTGYPPTEIECDATTGEKSLIKDKEIDQEKGGSFDQYGPLMQAFTGFSDSRETTPFVKTGRIARFDESGRMGPKAYSIITKARQKKEGDDLYGRPVLPGAGAIWTSNPVGPRYPDRHAPDPAMRRELAEIPVPYPDMSPEKPELYEFALTALFDANGHISVAEKELAPAYIKNEIPEVDRKPLVDGSIPVAKDELVVDMTDMRHGALYRFAAAIHALQESFVYGNSQKEKYPDTLLRCKPIGENVEVTSDGSGDPLILKNSTVTLGELASWMSGFNERQLKQDKNFRTKTLTEWLNFKIQTYIKQADDDDKEKLIAIFKHFHFLDGKLPDLSDTKPMTPKNIGYLSPRVPRPLYVERPVEEAKATAETEKEGALKEVVEYETKQVLLEDGTRVLIKTEPYMIGDGESIQAVKIGTKVRVADGDFAFSGIVDDKASKHNGRAVGESKNDKDLYRVFETKDLEQGIFVHESETLMELIDKKMPEYLGYYWKAACEGNAENNPEKIAQPV